MPEKLKNYIGGKWVASRGDAHLQVRNPATSEHLADVPLSGRQDVDDAVAAARKAFGTWRQVPPIERARYLFKYRALLEKHQDDLSRTLTMEHGKTLAESAGSLRRGIENVEHACGIPTLMMGDSLEDVGRGIDTHIRRQPVGVFAAVTPFNFPAMVPLWFWPYAVATGNCFVLKPSEQVPLSQQRQFELIAEAGFPPGVLNLVHGTQAVVESFCDHPGIDGISFVGSSPVAKLVYERATATGKRVQALGGAKNYVVVMPDANPEVAVTGVTQSCFGCAGQRCLAGSTIVLVGDAYDKFRDRLVHEATRVRLGNGMEAGVDMGPVISQRHKDRVLSYIEKGIKSGAKLVVDGRDAAVPGCPDGHWIGATVFDEVASDAAIATEEIFGPVLVLLRAKDMDDALAFIHRSPYANATSLFTTSGPSAREFEYRAGVSMMGINIGVAAPLAFFPFGGTKGSFYGDLKAHGKDSIRFYTDAKVVISRWV